MKVNLLRTFALTGLCCASITSATMAMDFLEAPSAEEVKRSVRIWKGEWVNPATMPNTWILNLQGDFEKNGRKWRIHGAIHLPEGMEPRPEPHAYLNSMTIEAPTRVDQLVRGATDLLMAKFSLTGGAPNNSLSLSTSGVTDAGPEFCQPAENGGKLGWNNCPPPPRH